LGIQNVTSKLRLHTLAAATALAFAAPAYAGHVNTSGMKADGAYDRFIIRFNDATAENKDARALQRTLDAAGKVQGVGVGHVRKLAVGADVFKTDRKLNQASAEALMRRLANNPNVQYVELDKLNHIVLTPNDTRYSEQWQYFNATGGIKANEAWDLTTGTGSVVAVLDTGITTHSDIAANLLPGYDFIIDTFVSVDGDGRDSNPAEVVSLSLGGGGACGATTQAAIDGGVSRGTTFVIAAGNDNSDVSGSSPANCNNVIAVGSTTSTGARSSFSNYGSGVDIAAPGSSILSTLNSGAQTPGAESYAVYSGTSMATPHVAGVVALMQAYATTPKTPAQIEALIKSTARAFPSTPSQPIGAGIINARAAVEAVNAPPPNTTLSNGVPKTGLGAATGAWLNYTMVVPAGATNLTFVMSGGTGDADMYVKFGSAPTDSVYDCRPYVGGNAETCNIATAQAGTYYVRLKAYSTFSGVSLTGSYTAGSTNTAPTANFTSSTSGLTATFTDASTDAQNNITSRSWNFGDGSTSTATNPSKTYSAAGTYTVTLTVTDAGGLTSTKSSSVTVTAPTCGGLVLCNNVAVALPSVATGGVSSTYKMPIAAGKTVTFTISGGTGDADMYVRAGAAPTSSTYNCRPYATGNSETCTFTPATATTYYVNVRAYAAYSGVSLKGSSN
jgi:subtilisin family serine protease